MSEKSKQALKVENNQQFPNNNTGYITPSRLREFNTDMIDSLVDEISYNEDSASWNAKIAGISGSSGGSNISLNEFTASQNTKNATLASVTQSLEANDTLFTNKFNTIGTQSGSWDNTSLNSYTASNDTKWNTIGAQSGSWITESETASFARTDVTNNFTATQNFTNVTVSGTASVAFLQVTYESSSVIYSSGSNQFGDAANDVQTLYGSTRIMNELTASGLRYPTADNGAESFMQTDGAGNLSLKYVKTLYQNIRNREAVAITKGTPLFVSGSTGDNADVYIADAGNPLRMPATLIAGDATLAASATGKGIILGHIEGVDTNAYPAGTEVYVAVGGGWTSVKPTGSTTPIQPLGVVTRQSNNGMGIVLTQVPFDLPNIQQGYLWVGDGTNQAIAVATSSLVTNVNTGSLVSTASFNSYTQSNDDKVNQLINATASYVTETESGSFLTTASFDNGTRNLTFTKGDITTFTVNIPDVSGSTINTGSFATTGSNQFTGIQTLEDTAQNILALVSTSGSLMLVAEGFNSSSAHITASSNANTNLIFKNNDSTSDTVLAGSSNIISNFPAPTAGFKRYFTTGNVALSNGSLQISASMAFPLTSSGNYYANVNTTVRGPVSSSTWFISNNDMLGTLNFGSSAANNAEKAISGVTFVQNFQNGTFNFIANRNTLNTGTTIRQSSLGGNITFNAASSSLLFENNLVNGGLTLTNSSLNTTTVPLYNQAQIVGGAFIGNSNSINISGSTNGIIAGDYNKQIISSNILGIGNTFSLERNVETVSTGLIGTTMIGAGLIVTGSNEYTYNVGDLGKCGGLFAGRFNSADGTQAGSGETVFAVGTGTGTAGRRTGFLIDSGSNTYVSGTFNVNGTSNFGGAVAVNDSNMNLTNSSSLNLTSGSSVFVDGAGVISGSIVGIGNVSAFSASIASQFDNITFDSSSFLITASVNLNTITFTKGDTTTFNLTVDTGSAGGGGGFPYSGDAQISGSLGITGSFRGFVNSISIASSTASIDMNQGNFFTLSLPSSGTTHITATNIKAGQTINLKVVQNGTTATTVAFSPNIKFAGGYDYTATPNTGAVDLLSFVTFDTTEILATSVKNLL